MKIMDILVKDAVILDLASSIRRPRCSMEMAGALAKAEPALSTSARLLRGA